MPHDDLSLLKQWSTKGDGDAFSALVARYGSMVYGACRRILGNATDAEDITQECFEALATAGTKPGAYVGAWLHRVATYHAISHIRSDVRRKERETHYSKTRNPVTVVEWKDIYTFVDEAIEELPEKFRRPLVAHFLEGQSKEAVGQALGISRQLASHRVDRGLECVRAALRKKGISLGALLLASLLGANAAEAAPSSLAARLGKISLTGPTISAPVAVAAAVKAATSSVTGATVAKVAAGGIAVAAAIAVALFLGWKEIKRPYPTQNITAASVFSAAPRVPVEQRLTQASSPTATSVEGTPPPAAPESVKAVRVQALVPGTVVYGVVLDENARPVPKATVTLDNKETMAVQEYRKETIGAPITSERIDLQQTTNALGEFTFTRVPISMETENNALVLAAHSGDRYAVKTIGSMGAGRQRYCELVLSPAGIVRGILIDSNNTGVPGAFVHVSPARMLGEMLPDMYITKSDGSFESRPLAWGSYEIMVSANGFSNPERPWVYPDGTETVIRLERKPGLGSISGFAVSAEDGHRIPGIGIRCSALPVVTTDANGGFTFNNVEPWKVGIGLGANSAPYALAEPVLVDLKPAQHVTGVELKITQGLTVSGHVLARDSRKPIADVRLVFQPAKGGFSLQAVADADGRFTISQLGPGDYGVLMNLPGYVWSDKTTPLSVHTTMESVELLMEPVRAVRGEVRNTAGTLVAGASVIVIDASSNSRVTGYSDGAGQFQIPVNDRIGSVYAQAYGDGSASKLAGPKWVSSQFSLRLLNAGAIEGLVVDTAGKPVNDAIVVAVPSASDAVTALNSDGSEWAPQRGIAGIKARTSSSGTFEMDPVLPGKFTIEVYLPSSAKGYPVAEADVAVDEGETLTTKLVVDLVGYGSIQGLVTQNGAPRPSTLVNAYSTARDWMTAAETYTDENGRYVLANIRAGSIQVTAMGEGHKSRNQVIQLAADDTQTVDFNFEHNAGGIEGYFTINGKPGTAFLTARSTGSPAGDSSADAITDGQGYYHIPDLAPGTYTVSLQNARSGIGGGRTPSESTVEVTNTGYTRCDFTIETGQIQGTVLGLSASEKAGVGVFAGNVAPGVLLGMSESEMDAAAIRQQETSASGAFEFDDIPPGVYTVGVIALPTAPPADQTGLAASIAAGRYSVLTVEIVAGKVTTLEAKLK